MSKRPPLLESLLAQLAALLGLTLSENEKTWVRLTLPHCRLKYRLRGPLDGGAAFPARETAALEAPMPPANPDWLWLSPTEEAIVRVASATEWKPAARLAEEAGLPPDRDLNAILRNMVERKVLESLPGRGFRLKDPPRGAPPPGSTPREKEPCLGSANGPVR
jgi:hypothetical protein